MLARSLKLALMGAALCGASLPVLAYAAPAQAAPGYSIGRQDLGQALLQLAQQASRNITFSPDLVRGRTSAAVAGAPSFEAALGNLLAGSGLSYRIEADGSATVSAGRTQQARRQVGSQTRSAANTLPDALASNDQVSEVIVTAQKRAEPLSKVPVGVTVIGGGLLDATANHNVNGIEFFAPSVTLNHGGQGSTGGFRIRGIGTQNYSGGVEPSAAVVSDGVVIGTTAAIMALQFTDVERVEVLNGPQGTLFGKNASAGVLNITNRAPSDHYEGGFEASYGMDNAYRVAGTISGPMADKISGRLTAFASGTDGWLTNKAHPQQEWAAAVAAQPGLLNGLSFIDPSKKFYYNQAFGVRGKLDWKPDASWDVGLTLETTNIDEICCARTETYVDPDTLAAGRYSNAKFGPQTTENAIDAPLSENDREYAAILNATKHLGGGYDLISITGYRRGKHYTVQDQDYETGPPTAATGKAEWDYQPNLAEQETQEFRLQSPLNQPFFGLGTYDFVAGVYYFHEKNTYDGEKRVRFDVNPSIPGCSVPICRRDYVYNFHFDKENYAGFGQVNWHITPQLTLVGGARATHDWIDYAIHAQDYDPKPFRGGSQDKAGSQSADNVSGKGALQYQWTDDLMTYVSYSTGYKGPGYAVPYGAFAIDATLKPETTENSEVGLKANWFGHRLVTNVALYKIDYKNMVLSAFDVNSGFTRNFNAAAARSQGVDLDFFARPIAGLNVSGGLAYTDAKFVSFPNDNCYPGQTAAQGCMTDGPTGIKYQSAKGGHLQSAPKWKANIQADYTIELRDLPFDAFIQGDGRYRSTEYFDVNQDPQARQGAYAIFDLGLGVVSKDERYRLALLVKNVADKFHYDTVFNSTDRRVPEDYRRYFMVNLTGRF